MQNTNDSIDIFFKNGKTGVLRRLDLSNDLINVVFDTVRGLKAADLMKLLQTFADDYVELVSYNDFMRLVERQG